MKKYAMASVSWNSSWTRLRILGHYNHRVILNSLQAQKVVLNELPGQGVDVSNYEIKNKGNGGLAFKQIVSCLLSEGWEPYATSKDSTNEFEAEHHFRIVIDAS